MSEQQQKLIIVTQEQFAIYARDGQLAALAQAIDELRRKRTKATSEVVRAQALLDLSQQHVALIDHYMQDLLRSRLALLEAHLDSSNPNAAKPGPEKLKQLSGG